MRKIYWRPRVVSRTALVLIAAISLTGILLVEHLPVTRRRPHYEEKMAATELAARAMERICRARIEVGPEIDPTTDLAQSGLIGLPMSAVTSVSGDLVSKQTTVNPNFAAVIVDMLEQAGVRPGDAVAVGCSGSFPVLNLCVYAALETLQAKPLVISSAAASQWGANVPELLWIDMERILAEDGVFHTRSAAASVGGHEDRGLGLSKQGLRLVEEGIQRNGLTKIDAADFTTSIDVRMDLYRKLAGRSPIKAYINVGGGTVSVGRSVGKKLFHPGLNWRPPAHIQRVDGVMPRFIRQGIPVINLVQIPELAERYELPVAPATTPDVGQAPIFVGTAYNRWLAGSVLIVVLGSLYGFIRSDVGFRLLRVAPHRSAREYPEPMI